MWTHMMQNNAKSTLRLDKINLENGQNQLGKWAKSTWKMGKFI